MMKMSLTSSQIYVEDDSNFQTKPNFIVKHKTTAENKIFIIKTSLRGKITAFSYLNTTDD